MNILAIIGWLIVVILVLIILHLWKNLKRTNNQNNVNSYVFVKELSNFCVLRHKETKNIVYISKDIDKYKDYDNVKRDENGIPFFSTD